MSTRGFVAWTIDGKTTYTYNHSDSYPSWLGNRVVEFLGTTTPAQLRTDLAGLHLVDESADATADDLAKYAHLHRQVSRNWDNYALFRDLQGDLAGMIGEGVASVTDGPSGDGEYGYTIDLDTETLTITESDYPNEDWKVLAAYPLADLPTVPFTD